MTIVEFAVACAFIQHLVGDARLTRSIRNRLLPEEATGARGLLGYLVRCWPCAGAWIGMTLCCLGAAPWPMTAGGLFHAASAGAVLTAVARSLMEIGRA